MSTDALLDGWTVQSPDRAEPPVAGAARLLESFGASLDHGGSDGATLQVIADDARPARVTLSGWPTAANGSQAAAASRGATPLAHAAPNGTPPCAYAALRLAGAAAAAGRRGIDARLSTRALMSELAAPLSLTGGTPPELMRCGDGWVVVRWRDEREREVLRALTGAAGDCARADVVAAARLARILIGSVEPPPAAGVRLELGGGSTTGVPAARRRRPHVVDWSVLWAGPWATSRLAAGAAVERVEHPRRRDGLLGWSEGRAWWRRLNGRKRLALLDARDPGGRDRLAAAIAGADILVTSMTPRALRSLGFGDDWRAEHATGLLHIELVAFDEPWADAPGLGEHAAAEAGLLWRDGAAPAPPLPWADPLLGASALALARAWLASNTRSGGRVRLTLRQAARLAFADQSGMA